MSRLQEQNTGTNTGRYGIKKFSAFLPEVQTGDTYKCQRIKYISYRWARRKDAEPINRAILRDLLALYVFS